MIVGNGLIANAFREFDKENVIFFASGVSNSLETDEAQFQREEDLIRKTILENQGKLFVYFSTCSIYDSSKIDSQYVNHKLNMEHLVASENSKYLIARVSNAVGKGGNRNLLMNYIYRSLKNSELIKIHRFAKRNLIDVDDVCRITLMLLESGNFNSIVNIAYLKNFGIDEMVKAFENELEIKANVKCLDLGESYSIDVHLLHNYFKEIGSEDYLLKLVKKYYN